MHLFSFSSLLAVSGNSVHHARILISAGGIFISYDFSLSFSLAHNLVSLLLLSSSGFEMEGTVYRTLSDLVESRRSFFMHPLYRDI